MTTFKITVITLTYAAVLILWQYILRDMSIKPASQLQTTSTCSMQR